LGNFNLSDASVSIIFLQDQDHDIF
jgi:hypothetical protein